jgi:hypothetical protein
MSPPRPQALQAFVDQTYRVMLGAAGTDEPVRLPIERIFAALRRVGPQAPETRGTSLPACAYFESACRAARRHSPDIAALTDALSALAPRLSWTLRPGAEAHGDDFARKHANARIVGDGGIERPNGVTIGVSLMAPHTTYPDHRHPPEEVYIVLSPGEWRQDRGAWWVPGIGGLVHNPPGILHSMRSSDAPLLAIWCLLVV